MGKEAVFESRGTVIFDFNKSLNHQMVLICNLKIKYTFFYSQLLL